jgi:hypothetical protein
MPPIDLGVLDTVISVVVVILLLSMVVQSVQTFLKKLLKFKSRQIQKSLEKLFAYVASSAPAANAASAEKVMAHFQSLGRTTAMGRIAIESISKADLSKVVTSIEGASIAPEAMKTAVQSFSNALREASRAVDALSAIKLTSDSVATLTTLRAAMAPIAAHVASLFQGETLDPRLLVKDVMTFSDFDSVGVLKLVSDLQLQLDQALAADPKNPELQAASKAAKDVATTLSAVNARLAQVVAPLRERISAINSWYDTVMLGFEERYARHMRTWAFIISICVVVILNADLFAVYKRLATSEVQQQRVLNAAKSIEARYATQLANAANNPATIQELQSQLSDELNAASMSYPALGIVPFQSWAELRSSLTTGWTIIGWLVMAALLSLGAPFWHDTLESLFGLKNFLRDKSNTNKVEQQSGAGITTT